MESPMDITELLMTSVHRGASDLHLSAGLAPMLRVDGEVWPLDWPVLAPTQVADLLRPLLNQYQQKDFETSLETDFAFELPGVARFRVNVF
jgi:twitching motility protein PilT